MQKFNSFKCTKCEFETQSEQGLKTHITRKHTRSKIHIQSGDQKANLEFIMDTLSLFYGEVCTQNEMTSKTREIRHIQRAMCGKCGKHFTNKKGVKQHILRMHVNKVKKIEVSPDITDAPITLNEAAEDSNRPEEKDTAHKNNVKVVTTNELEDSQSIHASPILPSKERDEENTEFIRNILRELQGAAVDECLEKEGVEQDEENNYNYQCGECGRFFQTQEIVQSHIETEHSEEEHEETQ